MKSKTTTKATASARRPKQKRSRESHERLLVATEKLMAKSGTADFTIPDVSRASGLSIGGIYRRFEDREALILAVQERLYVRMNEEYEQISGEASRDGITLRSFLDVFVSGLANMLKRNSPMIKAIMEATWTSNAVAARGLRTFSTHSESFAKQLLLHRESINHRDPEVAAEMCYVCIFELVASHLGVGRRSMPEHRRWPVFVEELQRITYSYLTCGGEEEDSRGARRSIKPPAARG